MRVVNISTSQLEDAKKYYKFAYEKGEGNKDPNLVIYKQHLDNIQKKLNQ